jgi:hypothetical protein
MKPRPFDYACPDTVEEAVAILAEHGDVPASSPAVRPRWRLNLRVLEPLSSSRIAESP